MAAISSIVAVAGLAITAVSAYSQYEQGQKASSLNKQSLALQRRQQELENRRANLSANRQRRQTIRAAMASRANALTAAAGQGALDSSGLAGGLAQGMGQGGENILGLNQGQEIGNSIYSLGGQISGVNQQAANAQSRMNTAQGLFSLGGALIENSGTVGKFFGQP